VRFGANLLVITAPVAIASREISSIRSSAAEDTRQRESKKQERDCSEKGADEYPTEFLGLMWCPPWECDNAVRTRSGIGGLVVAWLPSRTSRGSATAVWNGEVTSSVGEVIDNRLEDVLNF
jgi:hypothetical protein